MLRGRGILVFVITELLMGNSHINYVLLGKWHKSVKKNDPPDPLRPPSHVLFIALTLVYLNEG